MGDRAAVIEDLISKSGAKYKKNRRSFILDCPKCNKSDKLYIQRNDGRFICWVCGDDFRGKPEFALQAITGIPIQEIRRKLYGNILDASETQMYLGLKLKDWFDSEEEANEVGFVPQLPISPSPDFVDLDHPMASPGVEYLAKRGIPLHIAKEYGIMYFPKERRIIFPVISNGEWYGYQGRTIGPTQWLDDETGEIIRVPKSMTLFGFKKDQALMFADRVKGQEHVVLTEGPMDALKAHLVGGNVCAMGKSVSAKQLQLIKESGAKKLYLGLDPDAAPEIRKIVRKMTEFMDIYDLRAPKPYKDLGEMPFEEVKSLFDSAIKLDKTSLIIYLKEHYV